ncbi:MAG: hypothetical protein R2757_13385 [Draconibacterium sp.]
MKHLIKINFTLVLVSLILPLFAQNDLKQPDLKVYLSEDKSSYAGITMVNQIWTRYIWNNPDVNGVQQYSDFDLGVRRSRLTFYTYLFDRALVSAQIGADGMTYRSKEKAALNLIDLESEFIIQKEKLHIGFGLNSWNGVSRYNNRKIEEFLVVDNPGFAYPLNGTFDHLGRQLGVYAKGTLSKLHYRVSLVKPFETGVDSVSTPVTTELVNENFAVKGYFEWQFFDKENTLFPYMTMNNLGRAKMLNVGLGFYYHPQAMLVEADKDLSTVDPYLAALLKLSGQEEQIWELADYYPSGVSDIFLAAVDVFLDVPTKRNGAITSYLGYYYNFFGPDYLRSMSIMNVSKMSADIALPQGIGNSEWATGTGHIVRGEFGYLLPGRGMKNRFQPYGAFTIKSFEALDDISFQYDAGINWLWYGHNLKWTLQYSSRPIFTLVEGKNKRTESKGQIILQTQIYF